MALGVSVASATCPTAGSSDSPAICYGNDSSLTDFTISSDSLSWNGSSGGGTDSFYTLKTNSGTGSAVNITLAFNKNSSTASGSLSGDTYTITYNGDFKTNSQSKILQLSSKNNGIDMQGKTLTFDFGTQAPDDNWGANNNLYRKMILDLSGKTAENGRDISLKGDITIISGRAQGWFGENQFEATFGGDMIGDITIKSQVEKYYDIKTTFNFNDSASLTGNITANTGTNTFNFLAPTDGQTNSNDTTITGNITTTATLYANTKSIFNFSSSGTNTINGNITAEQVAWAGSNELTFTAGTNIINGNITTIYKAGGNSTPENKITANSSSTSFTINGSVQADVGGKNTLTLSTGENKINAKDTVAVSTEGGTNTINFSGGTTASITGDITAGVTASAVAGKNTITFNASTTNTIQGNINASSGTNEITFNSSGSFTGNITNDAGTNTIQAKSGKLELDAVILANGGGTATNTISAQELTINNTSLSAKGNWNGNNKNIITATTTGDLNFTSISVSGDNDNNKNIIAKDATATTTTDYLSDTHAFEGKLTVSKGISATRGENIISYKASTNANSTIISNISEDNGSKTFNTAISGSNTIYLNVKDSNISSGVDAIQTYLSSLAGSQASAYTTLAEKAVIAGDIVGSGSTNIKIVGKANVSASAGIASKTITNHNQIAILGNITTSSGATTNIVMQDSFFASSAVIKANENTQTTLGGEKFGNITNNGGTTNIVTRFSVNPNFGNTAVYNVINNSGTTNVVLQGKLDIGTHLDYTKNSAINLIFANNNNNNNGTDSFEASQTELTGNGSKILGVTYQDGVKLAIADKTVMIGDNPSASFLETYSSYYTNGSTALATVLANRTDDKDTISIHGLIVGNIYSLATSTASGVGTGGYAVNGKTYDVTLEKGSAFAGSINLDASTTSAINIVMNEGSKLILADASDNASANNFVISTLKITGGSVDTYQLQTETLKQSNTVINIATGGASANNVATRENFRLLTIGNANTSNEQSNAKAETGLQGEGAAVFMTYVNTNANQENATLGGVSSSGKTSAVVSRSRGGTEGQYGNLYSDRIIIANIGDNSKAQSGTYYMQFAVDANSKLGSVTYNASNDNSASSGGVKTAGNIAVLTVVNTGSNGSKQAGITLKTQDVLQGFDQIGGDLVAIQTDINGVYNSNGAYTTYFINNLTTRGATQATQEVTASAFATNYDLYMANFNSLNKRMGELRENNHSQGVWARVFTGSQTNDFSKSKSTYTTVQGGYDYAIGMEGANNYIGLAVAYAMSSSKSNLNALDITGTTKNIENIKSNAVEVAVYNSYVQDEGWYNDTIAKFSYIFSDFNITGQESTYSTNNMAFTLSDEFGYRFKLGSEKEWMIDPQLEVAFGYFNQSDFIQTLGLSSLEGVAEGIFTTRARLGSSFGYDFKRFTQDKAIKASVYVGAFYEYDYVTGGEVKLTTNLGGETTSSSAISSDGRVVMNVGTNVEIYDNTRIYFDFESSFAGKIRTDYQVNIGARYSFGESNGYTPAVAKAKEVAPLKVEEVKNTQENQAQESK